MVFSVTGASVVDPFVVVLVVVVGALEAIPSVLDPLLVLILSVTGESVADSFFVVAVVLVVILVVVGVLVLIDELVVAAVVVVVVVVVVAVGPLVAGVLVHMVGWVSILVVNPFVETSVAGPSVNIVDQ